MSIFDKPPAAIPNDGRNFAKYSDEEIRDDHGRWEGGNVHQAFKDEMVFRGFKSTGQTGSREIFEHKNGVVVAARYAPAIPAFAGHPPEPARVQVGLQHRSNDNFKGYKENVPEISKPSDVKPITDKHIAPYISKK